MAYWFRQPKGVYTRRTPEWYAHQRGRCSLQNGSLTDNATRVWGLFNNFPTAVYIHIIGIHVYLVLVPQTPIFGKLIMGQPVTSDIAVPATISPSVPLYPTDPAPHGIGVFGSDPTASFADAFLIGGGSGAYDYYFLGESAIVPPQQSFVLYGDPIIGEFDVMFEWYYAED